MTAQLAPTVDTMSGGTWSVVVADYLTFLAAGGAPATTVLLRRQHLMLMGRLLGGGCPWAVTVAQLLDLFARMDVAPETRRSRRTTARAFWRWGVAVGHTTENPALALPVVRATPPRPRPTPQIVYGEALARADDRTRLLLRLAHECGLRRAEVATGHARDLMQDLTGWSLVVHGKGDRERVVPLPGGLARDLLALGPGWFFPGNDHGHLSPRWVGRLVRDALPGDWTMHSLRHSAATRWYQVDRDVFTVQELLGHASPATTRRYVAVPNDALRATVDAASADQLPAVPLHLVSGRG